MNSTPQNTDDIDISKLDKAEVLAALYNNSQPLGMGILHYDPKPMGKEEAGRLLEQSGERPYFDYLKGRVMKVDLSGNILRTRLYDRDNGSGAAFSAISHLLSQHSTAP